MEDKKLSPMIFVKVPFGYGVHKFKLMKRISWGAVDHLILQTIAFGPTTPDELSKRTSLPKQLVIEILIPLMQAGWIEISHIDGRYQFKITHRGLAVSTEADLPVNKEPILRIRSFLVDPLTQQCYRVDKKKKQAFLIYPKSKVHRVIEQYGIYATEVRIKEPVYDPDISEIYSCVAHDDEEISGFESDAVKPRYGESLRYIIARVDSENKLQGVPDISDELRAEIISAGVKRREQIRLLGSAPAKGSQLSFYEASPLEKVFPAALVKSSCVDLLATPEEHRAHLTSEIRCAYSRLVIHSTFLNPSCIDLILEDLISAARRSVQIDILWGQCPPEVEDKLSNYKRVLESIESFQTYIDSQGLSTQLRFHREPTNSHSKFLISDRKSGEWHTTFGSCNWLSSNFNRIEASVRIVDMKIGSIALSIASTLAMGRRGLANNLSRDLAVQSARLAAWAKDQKSATPGDSNSVSVRVITAPEHHKLAKHACDEAEREIFVCSHRVSYAGDRPIFTPLKASIKAVPLIKIRIAFGRSSGEMKNQEARVLKEKLEGHGFEVIKADDPQIHAKFLTWDDNNLIVTSLNWLSASSKGDYLGELGVHVFGGGYSKTIKDSFDKFYG
ncbi:phospholipase D-like domain-containing protein [Azotobacter bryophylli]|uniref:Phospholipase D-like domain-containing protein n=1 Tax=Azotobacter bryophylli TaxID=1986537 RepID=A0ABV7AZ66_9GAMM